ncbi:hypothetical protein AB0G02_39245 [Actinosynnema sp. NPDC023658]
MTRARTGDGAVHPDREPVGSTTPVLPDAPVRSGGPHPLVAAGGAP